MSTAHNGTLYRVFLTVGSGTDLKAIASVTTEDINFDSDTIEASDKDSGGWQSSIGGRKKMDFSAEANLKTGVVNTSFLDYNALHALFISQEEVGFTCGNITADGQSTFLTGTLKHTGKVRITSLKLKAGDQALLTYSLSGISTSPIVPTVVV